MFAHHFKYTLTTLFHQKSLIFWTFAFPIILALLFNFAFSDIENNEKLDIFDIAIVNNQDFQNNEMFKNAFASLGEQNSNQQMFNISYVSLNDAQELLNDDKIVGYFYLTSQEPKVVTAHNGIEETVLKYVVEEISDTAKLASNLTELEIKNGNFDIQEITNRVWQSLEQEGVYIKDISQDNLSYMLIEFYTLVAMTCLYGGIIVMTSLNQSLANMSSIGKRISISPVKKNIIIFSSILASFIIELIGVFLLIIFTTLILHVNFGNHLFLIILLSIVGTIAGLGLGLFVSVIFKTNENTKIGIIIAISMTLSILSGMTGVVLKYVVDKNIPIINKINPANMITDGFYALYYYDSLNRYMFNLISLAVFASLLIFISWIFLRRQKYDSI